MYQPTKRFQRSAIASVVLASFAISGQGVAAQQDDEQAIEEVVTKGTRLKGTATAVIEERKNQAFVADILGAEQISRTGDGDAASALRRVTGLTLVDGKFIYVRGLGERYSSTSLNSSAVPSPDPTRNVVPLDLFPSDIIESLSVQKSYSPSMPASFGGGNVDIRLKSIPTQRVFNFSLGTGYNSENSDKGFEYAGGSKDWRGQDDGTRAAPQSVVSRWTDKTFLDDLSPTRARDIFLDVKRDYDPVETSISPDVSGNFTYGDSYDIKDKWRLGFLWAVGYDRSTEVSEEYELQQQDRIGDKIEIVRFFDDIKSTETTVQWSNLLTIGLDYNRNHQVDYSLIVLNDTRDEISEKFGNTENLSIGENVRVRDLVVEYEERTMYTNQLKGKHTFPSLDFAGFDWRYSVGRSARQAPGNFESRFIIEDANTDGVFDAINEISLTNAPTAGRYSFQELHDRLENYGFNVTFPMSVDRWEMEFKYGADFITKSRTAENRRFDVSTRAFNDSSVLVGSRFGDILGDQVLLNADLSARPILRDTTISGDDYVAAQKVDAYYFEGDFFFNNMLRFSGGIRWEDYRQVVAPTDPRTGKFDLTENGLEELAFNESKYYPAAAVTYILDDTMQFRASVGKTVVRPDLREVSSATYIDPLTDFPIAGTPGLKTTAILNYDLRWEWYREAGNNLSVGLFYKDMENPIESVQSPAQDGPPLIRIANAESGTVYGVEVEFLQGLEVLGDGIWDNLFVSGNLTVSDSEIVLDRQKIVEQTGVSAAITNLERRLTGHSKVVANLQLGFDSDNGEHSASLVYNVFGERILIPGIDGFDDSYEQPFHSLDTVYKYYPDFNTTITLKIQNILNQKRELEFEDVLQRSDTRGTGISLSYKYDFN